MKEKLLLWVLSVETCVVAGLRHLLSLWPVAVCVLPAVNVMPSWERREPPWCLVSVFTLSSVLCCLWFWADLLAHFTLPCVFVMEKEKGKSDCPLCSFRDLPPNAPLEAPPSPPASEDQGEAEVEGHYDSLEKSTTPVPAEL